MQNVLLVVAAIIVLWVLYKLLIGRRSLSPQEFMRRVRQQIAANHPNISVKSEDGFAWTLEIDGREQQVFLDNTYARCRVYPELANELIDDSMRAFSTQEDVSAMSWDDARPRLLPLLKPEQFFTDCRELPQLSKVIDDLVVLDWKHGLKVLIAIDTEKSMPYASRTLATGWNVGPDEMLTVALENLAKLTAPHWAESTERAMQTGLFAFATQDAYDASRVLLPDFYERASRALGSKKLLVGIPNRDFLGAISADAPWKDKFIKQVASDAADYDHAITAEVFELP